MTATTTTTTLAAFYKQRFRQNVRRVGRRLDAYLADQSTENNIHDVRTSIRRLDVSFSLLPKKLRKRKNRQIKKYRKFFKANSNARDLDIIRGKIAALTEGAPDAEKLLGQLQKKRKAELGRAGKLGRALKKMQPVQLDSSSIPAGKLESRIDRAAGKLGVKINDAFPVVLSDSSKVEELHRLRKDCKKLRYILEMVPPAGRKKYERAVSLALALEELQDLLGVIRDSDITIEYLQGSRTKVAGELAAREAGNRDQLYLELVRRAKQATTMPLRRAQ
jgi:CHAD domain-containing protein